MNPSDLPVISVIGCGWLGLPLASRLVRRGYTVRGSTTRFEKLPVLRSAGIEAYRFEATTGPFTEEEVAPLFESDLLFLNIPPGRRRPGVASIYPAEIRSIVDRALRGGVRRILFVSSTGVYPDDNTTVTEKHRLAASRGSGRALILVEEWLQGLAKAEVTILRMAGLVGEDRKAGRFLAGKKGLTNGDAPVNLVHLEDCIGVSCAVIELERWGEIYNVCADEHPTRSMFYTYQALKEDLEPPVFDSTALERYKVISNEKVKRELNYQFVFPNPMDF